MFSLLREKGIEPIVTLSHFETPYCLVTRYGGWRDRRLIQFFLRYAETVFLRYRDTVRYWLLFNEINHCKADSELGMWLAGALRCGEGENRQQLCAQAVHNLFVASAAATCRGREICPEFRIGCMLGYIPYYPATCAPEDVLATFRRETEDFFFADVLVKGAYPYYKLAQYERLGIRLEKEDTDDELLRRGTVDYIGFSYYMSCVYCADEKKLTASGVLRTLENPYLPATKWGWAIDPAGLRISLNRLYDRYNVPLMVVENGFGAADRFGADGIIHDTERIEYLRAHIRSMEQALDDGVRLIGYTPWSCIDLVSASTGEMEKRYGFVYVDRDNAGGGDLHRERKESFFWYQRVVASNGRCV